MTNREQEAAIAEYILNRIMVPDHYCEVRGLRFEKGVSYPLTAICDNPQSIAFWSCWMCDKGYHVYHTINPIAPESIIGKVALQSGRLNKILRKVDVGNTEQRSTKDHDIAFRRFLFIDIDPNRAAGFEKCCATKDEKADAKRLAKSVSAEFETRGWPKLTWMDSGNGFQGTVRVANVPKEMVENFLRYLAHRLDELGAHIDTAVSNASRIARTPRTLNRKGEESTEERPWRWTLEGPIRPDTEITSDQLRSFIQEGSFLVRPIQISTEKWNLLVSEEDVQELIDSLEEEGAIEVDDVIRKGGRVYWSLAECPFVEREHEGMAVGCGKTCIILGPDFLGFSCLAGACAHHTWSTLVKLLEERHHFKIDMPVYGEPDVSQYDALWGGVEDVTHMDFTTPEERLIRSFYLNPTANRALGPTIRRNHDPS